MRCHSLTGLSDTQSLRMDDEVMDELDEDVDPFSTKQTSYEVQL